MRIVVLCAATIVMTGLLLPYGMAQDLSAGASAGTEVATSPEPLSADELEVLVARIALYPDELVALISAASLYPLQIVEAARYLEKYEKDKNLKPKESWDGSVISLLNYPDIVKMMSNDLEWTQAFGNAIAYQQKYLLIAIQQLRDEAVAKGAIKTDDKVQVVHENDNVVIRPTNPEKVYVPQYEPEMLYEPGYAWAPIGYYPDPYPYYWYPGATFFAGAVTGAIWGAAVDWDDWGVWGGDWDGGDLDIDCNNCFNNRDRVGHHNGRMNFNDVDWKNVDRDKIKFDRNQINQLDRGQLKDRVKRNPDNSIRDRAKDIKRVEHHNRPGKVGAGTKDVRKSVQDGLKAQAGNRPGNNARPGGGDRPKVDRPANRPSAGNRPGGDRPSVNRDGQRKNKSAARKGGKPKPAQRADNRRKPSGLGNPGRGKQQRVNSNRGRQSMGGGSRGGGRKVHRGGRGGGGGGRGGGRRR